MPEMRNCLKKSRSCLRPCAYIFLMIFPALMTANCGVRFHKGVAFDDINQANFPNTQVDLLTLSYRSYHFNGPTKANVVSLLAAENVLARSPKNELANFFATRAAYWLIEFGGEGFDRKSLAELGFKYAQQAEAQDGSRAAYPFFLGVHLGYQMRESFRPQLINIRHVRDYFLRALELEPGYDEGAPLRGIGILLIKSPSWPTGVGDVDQGVEYLEKAVRLYPNYPSNHIYLAEAYMNADRHEDALAQLDAGMDVLNKSDWGVPGEVWKKQIAALRTEMNKKLSKMKGKKTARQNEEPARPESSDQKKSPQQENPVKFFIFNRMELDKGQTSPYKAF